MACIGKKGNQIPTISTINKIAFKRLSKEKFLIVLSTVEKYVYFIISLLLDDSTLCSV